jgi:hypothetical protein
MITSMQEVIMLDLNKAEFPSNSINAILPGETKNKPIAGERGESGENPHDSSRNIRANKGVKGRNLPLETYNPPTYPIEALDTLAEVCAYMRDEMQLPAETAGQSLLAAASLLTQGLYDVETLASVKPLSLDLLTLTDSGDGKSTADDIALRKITESDERNHEDYQNKMSIWCGLSKKERENEQQPISPYRMMKSGTIQGIVRSLKDGVSSQGSFTAEAASMLSGWGMSAEQKRNTLAGLNDLWDGSSISIVRQGEGRVQLYGKRFCCHWLIQPGAAKESLHDELFSTIGLWPRFLIAWPSPMEPRGYKSFTPESNSSITTYWDTCNSLLAYQSDKRQVMRLSDKARSLLIRFWEAMEQARKPSDKYHTLKPFCVRGAEQVCRVAGVLSAFRNHQSKNTEFNVIDSDIQNAIKLFKYSLDTWLGIFGKREDIEHQSWANDLYTWLSKRTDGKASETSMLRLVTPKHLRSQHKRDVALSILQEQGRIERVIDVLPNGNMQISKSEWSAIKC